MSAYQQQATGRTLPSYFRRRCASKLGDPLCCKFTGIYFLSLRWLYISLSISPQIVQLDLWRRPRGRVAITPQKISKQYNWIVATRFQTSFNHANVGGSDRGVKTHTLRCTEIIGPSVLISFSDTTHNNVVFGGGLTKFGPLFPARISDLDTQV